MPHRPLRKENNCLNCGAEVSGKYCQECGQENAEPKESAWHLLQHVIGDLTHFDGKLWHTARYLFSKPGFLSSEYMVGRRARYVNPVSLYFFVSAVFFLITFANFTKPETHISVSTDNKDIDKMDSASFVAFENKYNHGQPMTREEAKDKIDTNGITFTPGKGFNSRLAYDSALRAGKKHNWLERQLVYKQIDLNEKYGHHGRKISAALIDKIEHLIPQMFFVLLPLFALYLKLLYWRRKQFYYVNHAVFTLHLFSFTFIGLLFIFALTWLNDWFRLSLITFLIVISWIGLLFYWYKAFRKFYKQGRFKTVVKFLILLLLFFITILIVILLFVLLSLFQI